MFLDHRSTVKLGTLYLSELCAQNAYIYAFWYAVSLLVIYGDFFANL